MRARNELITKAEKHFKSGNFKKAEEIYKEALAAIKQPNKDSANVLRSIACCIINQCHNNPATETALTQIIERLDEAQATLMQAQTDYAHLENIEENFHTLLKKRAVVTWNFSLNLFDAIEVEPSAEKRTVLLQTALQYMNTSTAYYRELKNTHGKKYPIYHKEYAQALSELSFTHEKSFADYYVELAKLAANDNDKSNYIILALKHYLLALGNKLKVPEPTTELYGKILSYLVPLQATQQQLDALKQVLNQCNHATQTSIYSDLFATAENDMVKRFAAENLCACVLFLKRYSRHTLAQHEEFISSPLFQRYKQASKLIEVETERAQKHALELASKQQTAKKQRRENPDAARSYIATQTLHLAPLTTTNSQQSSAHHSVQVSVAFSIGVLPRSPGN